MQRNELRGNIFTMDGLENGNATVLVLARDGSERALVATGTTVPNAVAGYAKGCKFIKTNVAGGTTGVYFNDGTTASCTFNAVGTLSSGVVTNDMMGTDNVKEVSLTLSNAQVKALRATPITIVAAPGAGKVVIPIDCQVYLNYAGTNAFTGNASDNNVCIKRIGGATLLTGVAQAIIQATNSNVTKLVTGSASISDSKTLSDNIALVVANMGAAEIAGNAGANNTVIVKLTYRIDTITWT